MLAMARQNYDLNGPGMQPWHFKARYQLFDRTGKPAERGTLEYWWASPKVYRASWIQDDGTLSDWHVADGKRLTVASGNDIRYLVEKIPEMLLDPVPGEIAFREPHLERKMVLLRGVPCPCVLVFDDLGPSRVQPFDNARFCFDPQIPVLLLEDDNNGMREQFGNVLTFQGRNLPRLFIQTVEGERILAVSVDTVSALDPDDPALKPPLDAKTDGIWYEAAGPLISGQPPRIPTAELRDPSRANLIAEVKIEKDGNVQEVDLINRPDPKLEAAAREAISQWRFTPTVVDGQPVAARSLIVLKLHPWRY
jgi:hypothetical protein